MRKLRGLNLRSGDTASLMDFARKLEDAKRVLTSMGPSYVSRLNNEDTILMVMKKLPDGGLKRKWTDIAGVLICSKVDFADFLNFIQKRADRLIKQPFWTRTEVITASAGERKKICKQRETRGAAKSYDPSDAGQGTQKTCQCQSNHLKVLSVLWTTCNLAVQDF